MWLLLFALAAAPLEKLAILDLEAKGVDKALAENVTTVVAAAVRKTKRYDVISRQDIEKMLRFEESKQMAGESADSAGIAAMGEHLGVAKMMHGSLGKIGRQLVLSVSLVDTKAVEVLGGETMVVK